MTDKRYQVGIRVTLFYVVALGIYAFVQRGPLLEMTPNEFGDALAGAASPLAFLWLVLGYLQQGDELRENTEALRLQAEELKNSVKQQAQMVELGRLQLSEDQARYAASVRPSFLVETARLPTRPNAPCVWVIVLTNVGAMCTQLYASQSAWEFFSLKNPSLDTFDSLQPLEMRLVENELNMAREMELELLLNYVSRNAVREQCKVQLQLIFNDSGDLDLKVIKQQIVPLAS